MRTIQKSCKNDKVNIEDDRNYRLLGYQRVTCLPEKHVCMCAVDFYLSHYLLEVSPHFVLELKSYQKYFKIRICPNEISSVLRDSAFLAFPLPVCCSLCFPQ